MEAQQKERIDLPVVFVSTGGFSDRTADVSTSCFLDEGIRNVELSGGLSVPGGIEAFLQYAERANFVLHNYFPPPKVPFVFNLASGNESIIDKCLDHARNALQWSFQLHARKFAIHAGFLFDPAPEQLGQAIPKTTVRKRQDGIKTFIENVRVIAEFAEELGIRLLLENNPVIPNTMKSFGFNPFLLAEPEESRQILSETPDNVGLLVDVGHLNVSANTLGFDSHEFFDLCGSWIEGFHLNSNDGRLDSNGAISKDDWYWPHVLDYPTDYYTVEVYGLGISELRMQQQLVEDVLRTRQAGAAP